MQHTCLLVKCTLCRELLCHCSCNKYACWPSVTATNTAAVQTCLLVECCCKMDACWTIATQSEHACQSFATQSCMPAGVVSHYQPCLLVLCLTIGHAFWCSASLSIMPAGVLPHYMPCFLVWCLIISHAFWCGASI